MLTVITGLDGSGTSTIAEKLHKMDENSILVKTPSLEYSSRDLIDKDVRKCSQMAHYLYYLSSVVYMSDYIKNNFDYKNNNVYCVRYLIDTVVSHRVAGLNVNLDYNIMGHEILKPDLTIFVSVEEELRQSRITERGKSILDKVLDDTDTKNKFLQEFGALLENVIYFNNNETDIDENIRELYFNLSGG
ncbi:MAG: AAA family ATPase [Clostridia bacterium]|nr:AAA family ATPase [Clostridia bacterium]